MPTTYEGRLAPKGVSADAASELREFQVEIDSLTAWDDIRTAIEEQIIADGIMSRWALQKHWDISIFTQVDASRAQQLRDVLRSSRHDIPVDDDTTHVAFQLYDERADTWDEAQLRVQSDTYAEFEDWVTAFNNRNVQSFCLDLGQIHEATIRAVAEKRPSVIGEFAPEPVRAQTQFVRIALNNKALITDHFNSLTI